MGTDIIIGIIKKKNNLSVAGLSPAGGTKNYLLCIL